MDSSNRTPTTTTTRETLKYVQRPDPKLVSLVRPPLTGKPQDSTLFAGGESMMAGPTGPPPSRRPNAGSSSTSEAPLEPPVDAGAVDSFAKADFMAAATAAAAKDGDGDELAKSLAELFTFVSDMVRGELQGTNCQLQLLEKMNVRVAEEYNNFGDVAAGLRVYVEQLKDKNCRFDGYTQQIDLIDQQVTELEAVVSMLDKYVTLLESKIQAAYGSKCSRLS